MTFEKHILEELTAIYNRNAHMSAFMTAVGEKNTVIPYHWTACEIKELVDQEFAHMVHYEKQTKLCPAGEYTYDMMIADN